VKLIQQALAAIDNAAIEDVETGGGSYGESTAAAVLAYNTKRQIINTAYQNQPDDIVGSLAIKRLDDDMVEIESGDETKFYFAPLRNALGRTY
jgi:phosphoribosylformimino-5-aminoimidazole carboxamide ribonucleotide (ProFAR) isomerase